MSSLATPHRASRRHHVAPVVAGLFVLAGPLAGQTPVRPAADKPPKCQAVATASAEDLEGATLGTALQGRIPGVTVVNVGSGGGSVNIRGMSSVQRGRPLVYLDGMRITEMSSVASGGMQGIPLFEFVNPADIDRIEVLRGPAATIRYGSDAANGVIRIITKRGRPPKPDSTSTPGCTTGSN